MIKNCRSIGFCHCEDCEAGRGNLYSQKSRDCFASLAMTNYRQLSIINRRGAALLVVLFIIMAITILSLGFLSRSDVELACGQNMLLHTQMDYLAESGLEHAKGLILNPQDIEEDYWSGDTHLQLDSGSSDFYDVDVTRDSNDRCNYFIDCTAYREKTVDQNTIRVGQSSLSAELRLDPCIALSVGQSTTLWSNVTVNGDVNCVGTLTNQGNINGDVFGIYDAGSTGNITGQKYNNNKLTLDWPVITFEDFTSRYSYGSLSGQTFGPYNPPQICYSSGSLALNGNVSIDGMLFVNGDLTVSGNNNKIVAGKNLPALYVTGDLILEKDAILDVNGLAIVNGNIFIGSDNSNLIILGGLFVRGTISRAIVDSSGYGRRLLLYDGPAWRPSGGQIGGALEFDGTNDRAEDPCAPDYLNGLSAITIGLWVKSDVTNQDRDIFFTHSPTGDNDYIGLRYDKQGYFGYALKCIKASIRATSGATQIESSSDVQRTSWQHLAMVWQSGTCLKLYIDGSFDSPTHNTGERFGVTTGTQKFILGFGTKSTYWDGLIDDVQIYNRGLSDTEINTIKTGATLSGLIAHWKLDDSGNSGTVTITAEPAKSAIITWSEEGTPQKWGQAAGAFFRSIQRR
ncbi:MAG: hypothetical protein A2173_00295 [Planctomycetes bacterium RBG_13_44_8b]|nr:MAG: hypothetical protein A2173_00295 [Planctomycetes bacterium RBG_13_44_8b]